MKTLTFLFLMVCTINVNAQNFAYLEDIKLKKEADLIANEQEVIKATNYSLSTPIDDDNFNRLACSRLILRYAEKTPMKIVVDNAIMKVCKKNDNFLFMYMGLWIKAATNEKEQSDDYYKKYIFTELSKYAREGNNVVDTKTIKKLIEAGEKDEIEKFLTELQSEE